MKNLINDFLQLAIEHGVSLQSGDDQKGNKNHSKIQKVVRKIQNSEPETKEEFYELLNHPNPSVKCWVAIELIGTEEQKSLKALSDISLDNGIIGLTAKSLTDMYNKGMIKKDNWKKATT